MLPALAKKDRQHLKRGDDSNAASAGEWAEVELDPVTDRSEPEGFESEKNGGVRT
jgi:hypothetical protein